MIRTPHFHCRGKGSIPGWGTKILEGGQHGKKKGGAEGVMVGTKREQPQLQRQEEKSRDEKNFWVKKKTKNLTRLNKS